MDHAFQGRHPPRRLAAMVAAHQPPSDVSWFSDTSVTHHITSDLDNLSIHRPYRGSDSVQVGNGQGLSISHVGSATLHTPTFTFRLHNVLIDDFSRYCWIYPLLFKSHVFTIFCTFKAYVENLLDLKIKTFRSDGGGEFKNNKFKQYFSEHGIFHQFSCPHTPEQNGVAKRKHRHLVETGFSLIAHSSVPSQYWFEVFNIVVYLINRMPLLSPSTVSPMRLCFLPHLITLTCGFLAVPATHGFIPYSTHKL